MKAFIATSCSVIHKGNVGGMHCDSHGIIVVQNKDEALGKVYTSVEAKYSSCDGWHNVCYVHEISKELLKHVLEQL